MPSSRDLLDDARRVIPEVTPAQAAREASSRTLIDVRERSEFEEGHIPGALHLSKGFIEVQIEDRVPGKDTPITLYCERPARRFREPTAPPFRPTTSGTLQSRDFPSTPTVRPG